MINSFFGFTKIPFQRLTNLTTIFQTNSLSFLQQRIQDFCVTKGLALICGESGCGKTTAISHLIKAHLDTQRFKPIYLNQYPSSTKGFLRLLITQLGYPPKFFIEDILTQFPQIIQSLQAESRQIPFFIFDEAQNLSQHVLEELRLITNHDQSTLPAMVLVAHGAFRDRLKLACFHSLRYRLNLVASIEPLSKSELNDYIHFHLKLSGSTNSIFLEESITSIFNASKGLPRLINRICLEALYSAAQKNLSSIDQSIIESVLIDLI